MRISKLHFAFKNNLKKTLTLTTTANLKGLLSLGVIGRVFLETMYSVLASFKDKEIGAWENFTN